AACRERGTRRAAFGHLALSACAAAFAGAVQLFASYESFAGAARAETIEAQRGLWSFPLTRVLEFVWPNIFGEGSAHESFASSYAPQVEGAVATAWAARVYIGPVVVLLALAGASLLRTHRAARALTLAGGLAFWIALGPS